VYTMIGITSLFIQGLYRLEYPVCCSDWHTPIEREELGGYGILLKKFSLAVEEGKQLRHAFGLNEYLGNTYTEEEVEGSLRTYNRYREERKARIRDSQSNWFQKLGSVPGVSVDNDDVWGSKRQYLYGYVCSEIMRQNNTNMIPYMCSALNPTGGICGAGNKSLYSGTIDSPVIMHSCIHDASGYCYTYHELGRGYNYLGTYFALPSRYPMSCQMMGIYRCWRAKSSDSEGSWSQNDF